MENIREETERIETDILCSKASLSKNSRGRKRKENPCSIRTVYQCDRDRIVHSKAFRRLKRKTQVFISPEGDHYRTRLTHTLEVSQIARTVARALRLNEDLTEAISLGHDLGHTPFGHAGEDALNEIYGGEGFRHFEQSVRVVELLENDGAGLNLTQEVRDGILHHTCGKEAFTPEGKIVRICDKIAYINHDIDDALRAGILKRSDIPLKSKDVLGNDCSERINTLVRHLIVEGLAGTPRMSGEVGDAFDVIHKFMYERVYLCDRAKLEEKKAPYIIKSLYEYFTKNHSKLPSDLQLIAKNEGLDRAVCDYIAGMTDDFAIRLFKDIFIPRSWQGIRDKIL